MTSLERRESPFGQIPNHWQLVRLADITIKIGSGATPRGGKEVYLDERINFALIRSQNIFDRYFDATGLAFISDEHADELKNVWLESGDVLLNITGDGITFARSAIVPDWVLPACVNQHVSIIRVKPDVCLPGYLVSYLTHPEVKHYIESFNAGGSRRAITKGHIESFVIPLPPIEEQRAIAEILGALDDKIEANRRQSETLEATARAIFRSWFVDFDPVHHKARGEHPPGMDAETVALFPDSFEESEQGLIPYGWGMGRIADISVMERNSLNPGNYPDRMFWHYSLPAYDENRMPRLEYGQEIKSNKYLLPNECVLLSKLNPQNMKVWIPLPYDGYPAIASTEFLVMIGQNGFTREYLYTLFTTNDFARIFSNLVTGTSSSHQRVKPAYLMDMDAILPPGSLIDLFASITKPVYQSVLNNREESRTLAETRDALLPRLVSGELRVGEV